MVTLKNVLYVKQLAYAHHSTKFKSIHQFFAPKAKFLSTTLRITVTSYNQTQYFGSPRLRTEKEMAPLDS